MLQISKSGFHFSRERKNQHKNRKGWGGGGGGGATSFKEGANASPHTPPK